MAPAQDHAALADHCPLALTPGQGGALFNAVEGLFRGAAEDAEDTGLGLAVDGIVTPLPGRDHAAIEAENTGQLAAIKKDAGGAGCGVQGHRDRG